MGNEAAIRDRQCSSY